MGNIKVYTNLLRIDQVIASPVFDENGLLLAGEGTRISENNLYLLKSSGPEYVDIIEDNFFKWQKWMEKDERVENIIKRASFFHKDKYVQSIKNALVKFEKERKND